MRITQLVLPVAIILIYTTLRVLYFWQIPIFEDEALFTGWSKDMVRSFWFWSEPLKNGISPLFSWVTALAMLIIPNQFAAGRAVSTFSGVILLIVLTKFLKKRLVALYLYLTLLLYCLLPIVLVYTRLALLDMLMVNLIFVALLSAWDYLESGKKIFLILFLASILMATLTKPISFITLIAVLVAAVLTKTKMKRIIHLVALSLFSLFGYGVLIFNYRFTTISILSNFIFHSGSIISLLKRNIWLTLHWMYSYYPAVFLLLSLFGLFTSLRGKQWQRFIAVGFLAFFLSILGSDTLYFPRHTLVFAPFMIIFCAVSFEAMHNFNRYAAVTISCVTLISVSVAAYSLVSNPENSSSMAKEDKFQFYQDWTSGKIISHIAASIDAQSLKEKKIIVWTDDSSLYYQALPYYLDKNKENIVKKLPSSFPEFSAETKKSIPEFILINKDLPFSLTYNAKTVFSVSSRHEVVLLRLN